MYNTTQTHKSKYNKTSFDLFLFFVSFMSQVVFFLIAQNKLESMTSPVCGINAVILVNA